MAEMAQRQKKNRQLQPSRKVSNRVEKWKNLATPFLLDQKVYPCVWSKEKITDKNLQHVHFWLDSISIYPKLDSQFAMTAILVQKIK